ncbi:MAG TPA: hypothetical protein VFQ88_13945 [Nevskiaceae bacterium]|nr:hypothetical protein [Nevskiaceae bacterium]
MPVPHPPTQRIPSPPAATANRQFNLAFASVGLSGLSVAERKKAIARVARLLLLAAGLSSREEPDDEH